MSLLRVVTLAMSAVLFIILNVNSASSSSTSLPPSTTTNTTLTSSPGTNDTDYNNTTVSPSPGTNDTDYNNTTVSPLPGSNDTDITNTTVSPSPGTNDTDITNTTVSPSPGTNDTDITNTTVSPSPGTNDTDIANTTVSPSPGTNETTDNTTSSFTNTTIITETTSSPTMTTSKTNTATTAPPAVTAVSTSTTTITTTTSAPAVPPKPADLSKIVYKLIFSLTFYRNWSDPDPTEYADLKLAVENTINAAFSGCPGYKPCNVTGFRPNNETDITSQVYIHKSDNAKATDWNTTAVYDAFFAAEAVVDDDGKSVANYINGTVVGRLATSTVTVVSSDGVVTPYTVDPSVAVTMTQQLNEEMTTLSVAACDLANMNGEVVCDPCYNCTSGDDDCSFFDQTCSPDENKFCLVKQEEETSTAVCSCEPGYLPVGEDCVDEALIIGLAAGLGGALVLGLVIALIIQSCRGSRNSHDKKSKSSDSEADLMHYDEPLKTRSSLENIPAAAVAADDVSLRCTVDGPGDRDVVPAAVHTAAVVEAASEVRDVGVDGAPAVAVVTAAQAPPLSPDYDLAGPTGKPSSMYYNETFAAFDTFVPQLQNVDPYRNFAIKRPTALSTLSSSAAAGSSNYQNPAYYQDFF